MAWKPNRAKTVLTRSGLRARASARWVDDSMTRPSRMMVAGPSQPISRSATTLAAMPPTAIEEISRL